MEKGGQEPLSKPSQMVKEGQSCMLEQRRVIMAVTHMLDSGTLDERSSRLLEQLAGCIRCRPTEAAHGSEADPEAAPQPPPPRKEPAEADSSEELGVEPNPNSPSGEPAEKGVVVGSLRTAPGDEWICKVPSCTGRFHRLKDCRFFHGMEPEDRVKLVEHHDLCLGCLTPGHGRAARSCPYTEEIADGCQRSACKGRHHHLLHMEKRKAKKNPRKGSPAQLPSVLGDPTPTEDPG